MFEFERPNIEVAEISEDKKYGRFVVEPLERMYVSNQFVEQFFVYGESTDSFIVGILAKKFLGVDI